MPKAWFLAAPDELQALLDEVAHSQPGLHSEMRGTDLILSGEFVVAEGDTVCERYLVEIQVPPESKFHPPVVRETAGAFPWDASRHMEPDGKACIVLPDAFWYEYPDGMYLAEFIGGPLRSFFASQALLDLGLDAWPGGEWAHGNAGIIDFYEPLLGTNDPERLADAMRIVQLPLARGHWICPCGSNKKLRDCHMTTILELRSRIPREIAAKTEQRLTVKK